MVPRAPDFEDLISHPRRRALFMARSILRALRDERATCLSNVTAGRARRRRSGLRSKRVMNPVGFWPSARETPGKPFGNGANATASGRAAIGPADCKQRLRPRRVQVPSNRSYGSIVTNNVSEDALVSRDDFLAVAARCYILRVDSTRLAHRDDFWAERHDL